MKQKRLTSSHNKILGGVCGSIAESIGWNPTLVRVIFVLLSILIEGFPGLIVYIILWILLNLLLVTNVLSHETKKINKVL